MSLSLEPSCPNNNFLLVWKNFPTDEHWIIFEIKMIKIEEWENQLQFEFMDLDKDYFLTANEVGKFFLTRTKQAIVFSL